MGVEFARALDLALHLHKNGDLAKAERLYRDLRKAAPDHPDVTYNLAALLGQSRRGAEAVALLRRLLRRYPDFAAAHGSLGVFLRELGFAAEAVAALERANDLRPGHAPTLLNLGNAYAMMERTDEAAKAFRAAAAADAALPQPWHALTALLLVTGKHRDAEGVARAQLSRWPGDAEAWQRFGDLLAAEHRNPQAQGAYRRASALNPDSEAAHHAIRRVLIPMLPADAVEAAAAEAAYTKALNDLSDRYAAASPERLAKAGEEVAAPETFLLAYRDSDITGLLRRQGDLMARLSSARFGHLLPRQPSGFPPHGRRLRIGIVSRFFRRRHPAWKGLVSGWVAGLDRKRFHCIGFHTQKDESEDARAAGRAFDELVGPQPGIEAYIKAIGAKKPDILIFPDGPLDDVSHRLSALRLAPIQCATWGHPATTGLPTIDAFLSADALEPENGQEHYRERLLRVANLGTSYSPDAAGIPARDRAWFGLPADTTLFACVQSLYKYLPEHDDLLPRIAAEADPCRFVFFEDFVPGITHAFQARLAAAFAANGMDWRDHCLFLPRMSVTDFYATLGAVDVYLDTPGFSGFNTAMEALHYDVPVVTVAGRFLRSRLATGIFQRMGVTDGIAADTDGYVATAVSLARDRARRGDLSRRLADAKAGVWNDADAIASLEEHLRLLTT